MKASTNRRRPSRRLALGAAGVLLALVRVEVPLAQADGGGRHLDEFVVLDIGHRRLETHAPGRDQGKRLDLAGGLDKAWIAWIVNLVAPKAWCASIGTPAQR